MARPTIPPVERSGNVWGLLTTEPEDIRIYMSFDNIKSQQSPGEREGSRWGSEE